MAEGGRPAASAFPLLLDHMYGLDKGKLELTVETAAALYYLADYFGVEGIQTKVKNFWEANIGVTDLGTCLEQGKIFRLDA